MRAVVPGEGVIESPVEMRAYESDGLSSYRQVPLIVVLLVISALTLALRRPPIPRALASISVLCLGGLVLIVIFALVMGAIGGLFPARSAAKKEILVALRDL